MPTVLEHPTRPACFVCNGEGEVEICVAQQRGPGYKGYTYNYVRCQHCQGDGLEPEGEGGEALLHRSGG